jgi:hypothetical protein
MMTVAYPECPVPRGFRTGYILSEVISLFGVIPVALALREVSRKRQRWMTAYVSAAALAEVLLVVYLGMRGWRFWL